MSSSTAGPVPAFPGHPPFAPAARPPLAPMAFLPRLWWEAGLFVLTIQVSIVVAMQLSLFDSGGNLAARWGTLYSGFVVFGLLVSGFALSLRTATPNLAVAGLCTLAGVVDGQLVLHHWPRFLAGVVAVLMSLGIGLVLAVITAWTATPAWAVSLAGLALAQALVQLLDVNPAELMMPGDRPGIGLVSWLVLLVVGSMAGGALWFIPGLRAALAAQREPARPGWRRPGLQIGTLVGFGGSSLAAGLGGVLAATYFGIIGDRLVIAPELPLVVGATLLGGVSVFGRSGGIAGTMLAAWLLYMAGKALQIPDSTRDVYALLPAAVAIMVGLVVNVVFERRDARLPQPHATPSAGWPSSPAVGPAMASAQPAGAGSPLFPTTGSAAPPPAPPA